MTAKDFAAIRQQLGLTYRAMAQVLNMTPESCWRFENGTREISRKTERKIFALLNIETCPTCGQAIPQPKRAGASTWPN